MPDYMLAELRQHPLNDHIYGSFVEPEFIESIREHGVQEPITVCKSNNPAIDGMVVKGRRRCLASAIVGLTSIPGVEWCCDSDDELRKQLILSNVRNTVTTEQKALMFIELRNVESRLAAARAQAGVAIPSGVKQGRAGDLAASAIGMSRTSAERAEKVVKAARALKEDGKEESAKELIETLNSAGPTPAYKKLSEIEAVEGVPTQEVVSPANPAPSAGEHDKRISKASQQLKAAIKAAVMAMGAVVRAIDRKKDAVPGFGTAHRVLESKLKQCDNGLSNAEAAVGVFFEKLAEAGKGKKNGSVETVGKQACDERAEEPAPEDGVIITAVSSDDDNGPF